MLVHTVLFWLKKDLIQDQINDFEAGLNSLVDIASATGCYVGTPSTTDRPVIDNSYSYCLTVLFEGMEDHDKYQVDPLHTGFLGKFNTYWDKVVIYDAD